MIFGYLFIEDTSVVGNNISHNWGTHYTYQEEKQRKITDTIMQLYFKTFNQKANSFFPLHEGRNTNKQNYIRNGFCHNLLKLN